MLCKTAPFILALAVAAPAAAQSNVIVPPPVPQNLEVPEGNVPFAITSAEGTQNYICLVPNGGGPATWTFLGPQATLFNAQNEQLMTHYLSPNPDENNTARATWRDSRDTSTVWAVAIQNSSDPAYVEAGAIPWLLLRVVGVEFGPDFGDRLVNTTYIQRVNTSGGVAPATGCSGRSDGGKRAMVPYTTQYVFYR
jgi:hypothetical protein